MYVFVVVFIIMFIPELYNFVLRSALQIKVITGTSLDSPLPRLASFRTSSVASGVAHFLLKLRNFY